MSGRLVVWLCVCAAACSASAQQPAAPPVPDSLLILRGDGSPLPAGFAYGTPVVVQAVHSATMKPADGATWSGDGPCGLDGSTGATQELASAGLGRCTLTATADGLTASATIVYLVGETVKITGDDTTTPFLIGETRVYAAEVRLDPASQTVTGEIGFAWSPPEGHAFRAQTVGNTMKVTAVAVGADSFTVRSGSSREGATLNAVPSGLRIKASTTHVRAGSDVVVDAEAFGPDGARVDIVGEAGMQLAGAEGFMVGSATLGRDGSVFFALQGATVDCPGIYVWNGRIASNTLAITVEKIASVVIQGPPIVVLGSPVILRAVPMDAAGQPFTGRLVAAWSHASGVFSISTSGGLIASALPNRPGAGVIEATVSGVTSAPFVLTAVEAAPP